MDIRFVWPCILFVNLIFSVAAPAVATPDSSKNLNTIKNNSGVGVQKRLKDVVKRGKGDRKSSENFLLKAITSVAARVKKILLAIHHFIIRWTVDITCNSFADLQAIPYGFPRGCSFFILEAQNDNPMLSKEVANKIQQIIKDKGYVIDNAENADYYVQFNFGMTSEKDSTLTPLYIPGQTQTTQGSVYWGGGYAGGYQGQAQSPGSIIYVPQERISFRKKIQIQVYDAKLYKEKKQEAPLWQGSTSCLGISSDLRDTMDYLLVAAFEYFGKNTYKNINIEISSDDKEIKKLRRA